MVHKLTKQEVKLQEAVFEIFNGEEDLVGDLKLVQKTYADSLIHLNILSAGCVRPHVRPDPLAPAVLCQPVQGAVQGRVLV